MSLNRSYLLSIIFCAVGVAISSDRPSEFANAFVFAGSVVWMIAGFNSWMAKRKNPQQPAETQSKNRIAKKALSVLVVIIAFVAVLTVGNMMQEYRDRGAAEKTVTQLQAEATREHPDMPPSAATALEAIEKMNDDVSSEPDELKRKKKAAAYFFGFFVPNVTERAEFCREQGVDIGPFVKAFELAHANELAIARAIYAEAGKDEKSMMSRSRTGRNTVVQQMTEAAVSAKVSIKEECQLISANADAVVLEYRFSKIAPVVFKVLTSAK